jgi:hypothetical protein
VNANEHPIKCRVPIFRSVSIAFGFIGEFILRRSNEVGSENWGKAISCDPPQFFPGNLFTNYYYYYYCYFLAPDLVLF